MGCCRFVSRLTGISRADLIHRGMRRIHAAGPRDAFGQVAGRLTGRVLEIGCGTGLLFTDFTAAADVTGIDPDVELLALAVRQAGSAKTRVRVVAGDAQHLAFADDTFDAVVVQFVLCTVPDPRQGLAEILRVVRPGGLLYFYEHVVSDFAAYRWFQNLTAPIWSRLAEGCWWNRDTTALIRSMPVHIESHEQLSLRRSLMPPLPIMRIMARNEPPRCRSGSE